MSGDQFTLDPATKDELKGYLTALGKCLAGIAADAGTTMQGHMDASGGNMIDRVQGVWKQLPSASWFSSEDATRGMRTEFETITQKIFAQWCADGQAAIQNIIDTIEGQSQTATAADTGKQWGNFRPS